MMATAETQNDSKPKNIVAALKEQAQHDEAFAAIFKKFASRKRARTQVSKRALQLTMEREGHNIKPERYDDVLKFLANLGFGTLEMDRKGEIKALKNIKVTLQSIGQIATTKQTSLQSFKPKNQYSDLEPHEETDEFPAYKVYLTVMIKGTPVVFPGPDSLAPEDLGAFLVDFNRIQRKSEGPQ